MAKTPEEIINNAETLIKQKQPNADLSSGTVNRDIGIEAFAQEQSTLYSNLDDLEDLILLNDPESLNNTLLSDLASSNFGLSRTPATKASGQVTLGSTSQPTSIIPIGSSDGLGGIVVQTVADSGSSTINFVTTETVYLTPSSPYNAETGLYEVSANIEAVLAGASGNVSARSISSLSSPITGVDSVYNASALTNGLEEESNTELVTRIRAKAAGRILGANTSYKNLMLAQDGVLDAFVVDPNSIYSERGPGSIDIYIEGSTPITVTETFTYTGSSSYSFSYLPVESIVSVTGTSGSVPVTFSSSSYELVKDNTSIYRYSNSAKDYMHWLGSSSPNIPDIGTTVSVTLTYNGLLTDLMNILDDEDNHVVTNNIFVKEIVPVLIDIYASVKILAGYDSSTVLADILAALIAYVEANKLGTSLRQAAVISVIGAVEGVDYVSVPLTKFSRRDATGAADLTPDKPYEYWDLDSASVAITVL